MAGREAAAMTRTHHVVGGGIAGLAAAFELVRSAPDDEVVVHEPGRLGGKLLTTPFAGRMVDEGADAFLARVPWGKELADEVGLGSELVSPAAGNAYVAVASTLHPLPPGLVLGVPTDADALRGSPLVDDESVERVRAEPSLPGLPLADGDDPSVGALIRERFGDTVLERLVEPLIGGVNAGDADRLSVRAAVPQIAGAATSATSLVEGLRSMAAAAANPSTPVFWAPTGGMQSLADAVVAALEASGRVRVETEPVRDVRDLGGPTVLATPATATAQIVDGAAPEAARLLRTIGHSSPVLVTMAFRRADVDHALDASGFLVSRAEERFVTACSFASTKWAHLDTGDGLVLFRVSAGRYGDDRAIGMDDDDLLARMLRDLDDLLGIGGDPVEVRISRWRDGFAQYEPGHLAKVDAIEADLAEAVPAARVAGAAYRGIGVPACIRSGREAARALLDALG